MVALIKRTNPITLAARLVVRVRAVCLLANEMLKGAWACRVRWWGCLERARREI